MPTPLEQLVGTMTLAELADRSGRSIESIVAWAHGQRAAPAAKRNGGRRARAAVLPSKLDLSSPDGRSSYDARILEVVLAADEPVNAEHVRSQVGGTPHEVRTALKRLIAAKEIKSQGRARATRYQER